MHTGKLTMQNGGIRHRLLAILAADALDAARRVFGTNVESRGWRIIDTAGDSVLAVFDTASGAVSAAMAI